SIKKGFVSGTVFDESGEPLPGVTVIIKGTSTGVATDFNGNFSIQANANDQLVFSYIGYSTREIKISNNNSLSISLAEDVQHLDEVVTVGYNSLNKSSNEPAMIRSGISNIPPPPPPPNLNGEMEYTLIEKTPEKPNFNAVQIRKNLQETAFFFPQLQTDINGNVSFSFTTPEALTQWKLQLMAHTKTLESATKTLTTVTQKELMVIPNAPRFLREGDQISISTKISNLTDKPLSGQAVLVLTDAVTGKDITNALITSSAVERFSVEQKGNTQVSWN